MVLGVFLHSAQIFNPEKTWLIESIQTTPVAQHIVETIHLFRMPSFFVVSGFFCIILMKKYGTRVFFKNRSIRIGLPFITTAVLLNSLQEFILVQNGWQTFEFKKYIQGGWISHLWFLVNLLVYYIIAIVAQLTFFKCYPNAGKSITSFLQRTPKSIWLMLLPCISIVILASNKIGFPLYSNIYGILYTNSILIYLPYFFFGTLLGSNTALLNKFASMNLYILISSLIILRPIFSLTVEPKGLGMTILNEYLFSLSTWISVAICFSFFYRFFNKYSKRALLLSNASYTVYLFHQLIVIALGVVFINSGRELLQGTSGLILLVSIALPLSFGAHFWLINRVRLLAFLFNGKPLYLRQ